MSDFSEQFLSVLAARDEGDPIKFDTALRGLTYAIQDFDDFTRFLDLIEQVNVCSMVPMSHSTIEDYLAAIGRYSRMHASTIKTELAHGVTPWAVAAFALVNALTIE